MVQNIVRNTVNSFILCVAVLFAMSAWGEEVPEQALEAKLLQLDAELKLLEEDLLYPASSRVAVYLSMDLGELFALDAVTVKPNGKDVAHHLYTSREVDALYKGGVQKLYVGNAKQGENRLTAIFIGDGPHDRGYKRAASIRFEQSFEPVFVELSITEDTGSQQPEFVAAVFQHVVRANEIYPIGCADCILCDESAGLVG